MRYLVVFEKGRKNYSAYVPDLPGCVATGKTHEECEAMIAESIRLHIDDMRDSGTPIPAAVSDAEMMYVGELQHA
ncbi:MAG: type II toxin-antitoxin system HicB family antitoxin [Spirochaetota bacterium]